MKQCIKCKEEIPPQRLKVLPKTNVCVNCSNVNTYRAVTVTHGEGDHTWNDVQIMTSEQYNRYMEVEKQTRAIPKGSLDFNFEDSNDDFSSPSPSIDESYDA